jgi:ankyrin repeat protein
MKNAKSTSGAFSQEAGPNRPGQSDRSLAEIVRAPPSAAQLETVEELIVRQGAQASLPGRWGDTPLHIAVQNGNAPLVEKLLQLGARTDLCNIQDRSPLMEAALNGQEKIAQILLRNGAKANDGSPQGWTALMWAASRGQYACVKLLLQNGADTGQSGKSRQSALSLAVMNEAMGLTQEHVRIAELLIQHGADLDAKDRWGRSPADIIRQRRHPYVLEQLRRVKPIPREQRLKNAVTLQRPVRPMKRIRIHRPGP